MHKFLPKPTMRHLYIYQFIIKAACPYVCLSLCLFVFLSIASGWVCRQQQACWSEYSFFSRYIHCFASDCLPKSNCLTTRLPQFPRFWTPGHLHPLTGLTTRIVSFMQSAKYFHYLNSWACLTPLYPPDGT